MKFIDKVLKSSQPFTYNYWHLWKTYHFERQIKKYEKFYLCDIYSFDIIASRINWKNCPCFRIYWNRQKLPKFGHWTGKVILWKKYERSEFYLVLAFLLFPVLLGWFMGLLENVLCDSQFVLRWCACLVCWETVQQLVSPFIFLINLL